MRAVCTALVGSIVATSVAASALGAGLSSAARKRVGEAGAVLRKIHAVPDKDVPRDLWDRAACVTSSPRSRRRRLPWAANTARG